GRPGVRGQAPRAEDAVGGSLQTGRAQRGVFIMRCPTVEDLEQWLDEELDDASQEELARHVGDCTRCQTMLEYLTEKTAVLTGLSASELSLPSQRTSHVADTPPAFLARLKQSSPGGSDRRDAGPTGGEGAAGGTSVSPVEVPTVAGYEVLGELGRGG